MIFPSFSIFSPLTVFPRNLKEQKYNKLIRNWVFSSHSPSLPSFLPSSLSLSPRLLLDSVKKGKVQEFVCLQNHRKKWNEWVVGKEWWAISLFRSLFSLPSHSKILSLSSSLDLTRARHHPPFLPLSNHRCSSYCLSPSTLSSLEWTTSVHTKYTKTHPYTKTHYTSTTHQHQKFSSSPFFLFLPFSILFSTPFRLLLFTPSEHGTSFASVLYFLLPSFSLSLFTDTQITFRMRAKEGKKREEEERRKKKRED